MSENKINITSTAIEKGVDLAKDFLDKLIAPAIQETGLLISDQISKFRFNNQLKMLTKSREKCIKAGIDPKTISFKILCPLLEGASFEEDEEMIEVWSSLLSNLVDSEQNIENHIFPYLLGQISKQEWIALNESYFEFKAIQKELEKLSDLEAEYNEYEAQSHRELKQLEEERKQEKIKEEEFNEKSKSITTKRIELKEKRNSLAKLRYKEPELVYKLITEEYQYSNLYRLGLIRKKPIYYTTLEQPKEGINSEIENKVSYYNDDAYESQNIKLNLDDVKIHIEEDGEEYFLTDLGMVFIKSCLDKDKQ